MRGEPARLASLLCTRLLCDAGAVIRAVAGFVQLHALVEVQIPVLPQELLPQEAVASPVPVWTTMGGNASRLGQRPFSVYLKSCFTG